MLLLCAAIWCACAAFALAAIVRRAFRSAWFAIGRRKVVLAVLVFSAVVSAFCSRKAVVTVSDAYIQDAGSCLTNDVAHVAIAKRTPNLPDSTEILVYARELSSTNAADWFRLSPHLTYADHPYDYALPNATNYSVLVSSSFVPEPTVHTNGVWALRGFEIPGHAGRYAFGNSRTRTLPSAVDYVKDGLAARWDAIDNAGIELFNPKTRKWKDLSGQAYDFDVPATLSWSGDALVFPAQGDKNVNYLRTNHSFSQYKTIEFVAKFNDNNSSIIRVYDSNTILCHWGFSFFWNGTVLWSPGAATGVRHYAALCIDDNGWRAYRDGAKSSGAKVLSPVGESSFTVGWYGATTYALNGEVCTIRFYNRALTEDEIAHNRAIDRIRFNLPY
jgi:hypothetical protein